MVNPHEERCAYDKLYGNMTDYKRYLNTFRRNGICMQYFQCKIQSRNLINEMNIIKLHTETYRHYIQHVKSTHETKCTKK